MSAPAWTEPLGRFIPRSIARELHEAPDGARLSPLTQRWLDGEYARAEEIPLNRVFEVSLAERHELAEALELELPEWEERRAAEHALAHRLLRLNRHNPPTWIRELAEKMLRCRLHGRVGRKPDGGVSMAWDFTCSASKVCPDEARKETRRMLNRYIRPILWFVQSGIGRPRRVYYCVLTCPNAPRGALLETKRELMRRTREWLAKFENVKGALVVQEDPLGADGTWNVHNNVILLVEGELSYEALREAWGFNLHIRQVSADEAKLSHALLEVVKYCAKIVPTKSAAKADPQFDFFGARYEGAPAMVDYPDDALLEWLSAQTQVQLTRSGRRRVSFRRTRTYGVLHSLEAGRWDAMEPHERGVLLAARELDTDARRTRWRALDREWGEGTRDAIRARWEAEEGAEDVLEAPAPLWLGTVSWIPGAGYRVDLIPEDNSGGGRSRWGGEGASRGTGPPIH